MVCYARGAMTMAGIALVAILLLGKIAAHTLDLMPLVASVSAVFGGAAIAATIAFVWFRAIRRRRALAGGCVGCALKCQHAMTEATGTQAARPPRATRLWLISVVDLGAAQHEPAPAPQVVSLPMPTWPQAPLRGAVPAPRQSAEQREREPARGH